MRCIIHALALLFTTQLAAAEARVQDAEGHILDDTPIAQVQRIQGRAAAIRANIARYTGDLAGCVANGQQVLRLLPESETVARTIARLHVARAFRVSGAVTEEVEQHANALSAPFRAADNLLETLASITNLTRLPVLQGRLHAVAATYGEMAQIAASPDQPLLLEGPAYSVGMAELLYEWNDLDAAERHLTQAMEQLAGRLVVDAEDWIIVPAQFHTPMATIALFAPDVFFVIVTLTILSLGWAIARSFFTFYPRRLLKYRYTNLLSTEKQHFLQH